MLETDTGRRRVQATLLIHPWPEFNNLSPANPQYYDALFVQEHFMVAMQIKNLNVLNETFMSNWIVILLNRYNFKDIKTNYLST